MKIYFDTEFTGLHQATTLISLGMISDNDRELYLEFVDYDRAQVNDWLQQNVIANLRGSASISVCRAEAIEKIQEYLESFNEKIFMISDCLAYDWVLFCQLFGNALSIPDYIYYIPFDLSTAFMLAGIDPDISRKEFAYFEATQHNALDDARMIKACWHKLMRLFPDAWEIAAKEGTR